jgi:transposase
VSEWEFNGTYHKAHVSRLLKALDWAPQQPLEREATQRDEAAIIGGEVTFGLL